MYVKFAMQGPVKVSWALQNLQQVLGSPSIGLGRLLNVFRNPLWWEDFYRKRLVASGSKKSSQKVLTGAMTRRRVDKANACAIWHNKKMPDYKNAQIYKIVSPRHGQYYIITIEGR